MNLKRRITSIATAILCATNVFVGVGQPLIVNNTASAKAIISDKTTYTALPTTTALGNIRGDVSGNNRIDLHDVIIIAEFLLNPARLTSEQQKIADFDGNGVVDLHDAIGIAVKLLESEEEIVDTDGDNVEDYIEELFGSNPNLEDTDGDGLSDYIEIFVVDTDPTISDTDDNNVSDADEDYDCDGISNIDEVNLSLNPAKKDTDSDSLNDYDEIHVYLTLPDNYDTDGDTISDGNEIILGLDPCNPMSDGSTPDVERTFKQTLDSSNVDESLMEDNIVVPYISGNVPDVINDHVHIDSVEIYSLEDNRAAVGKQVEVSTDYDEETEIYINFTLNEDDERAGYYMVCQYVDNEFIPCETFKGDNTISALASNGTYFVVDAEELMIDLDIPITKYKSMSLTPMTFSLLSDNDDTIKEPLSRSNEIPEEWYKENSADISEIVKSEDVYFENIETFNFSSTLNMKTASSIDMKTSGQADIVFVIDSTGSMYDAIDNVVRNIDNFVDTLYHNYSVKANFALIDYKDIEYDEETILTYNDTNVWFSDVSKFKEKVNAIYVYGGEDADETPIDALGMAYNLNFRHGANKFVILVTDAGYKVTNNYGIESMESMAKMFKDDGIVTSVITSDYFKSDYEDLFAITGGVYGDIYGDFKSVLLNLSENIGEVVNDGSWVLLSDYQFLKLDQPLDDSGYSSDSDGVSDKDELGDVTVANVKPYIDWVLKKYNIPADMYTDATTVNVYKYKSNPLLPDTDFDGIDDDKDTQKLSNKFIGRTMRYDKKDKKEYKNANGKISFIVDYRNFFDNLNTYNETINAMSWLYATDIYENTSDLDCDSNVDVYVDRLLEEKHNITKLMETFGMKDSKYYAVGYEDNDRTNFSIGHHLVEYNGEKKEIILVSIRGTNGTFSEWSSNFDVGADTWLYKKDFVDNADEWINKDNHKGFDVTAKRVIKQIDDVYLSSDAKLDSSAEKVFWVTGHSRGAAIANIVSADLIDKGYDVTSYSFATPETTISSSYSNTRYDSIFNIINSDDLIPCLPLESGWGFHRYGVDKKGSISSASEKRTWYGTYKKGNFKDFTGINYNNNQKVNKMLEMFGNVANNRNELYVFTYEDDTLELSGVNHFSKEKADVAVAKNKDKLPEPMQKAGNFQSIKGKNGFGITVWAEGCYQTPAYFMQALADLAASTTIHQVAKKYEGVRNEFVIVYASGMNHPHWTESYYLLSNGTVEVK